jgi:outer membrane protein assembly factor BamB
MADLFTSYWHQEPVNLGVIPLAIHPAQPVTVGVARPEPDTSVRRRFINDERNSRLTGALGRSKWEMLWRADLPPTLEPTRLLASGDRALLYGALWQLCDTKGHLIATGSRGPGEITLDPERKLFFATDQFGLVAAYRTQDGQKSFALSLYYGQAFERLFLARRDNHLIATGMHLAVDGHAPTPDMSDIEIVDMGDPAHQKSWNDENGPVVAADLIRQSRRFFVAMHGGTIALSTEDRVYLLDLNLKFRAALAGSFTPVEMSLDELGRIYLLADTGSQHALWLVTPAGERLYVFELPHGSSALYPPIIGYDHTAYVISHGYIYAVGQDGKLNWSRQSSGPIAGATVTADDKLLTSEGNKLVAWDHTGERELLYSAPSDEFTTAPVLLNTGELLVGSRAQLYCLKRQ